MGLRNIIVEGDAILRKKCREVEKVDDKIRMILDDMVETMHEANGVGLAAPQIGILRRMFVVETEPGEIYFVVNPKIIGQKGIQVGEEGCLSVPDYAGTVERPQRIKIQALDRDGKEQIIDAEDFLAVAMSHENDHLDGILYIDKAEDIREVVICDEEE
ncbi:MAG: peptide deformylase [Eubacteriales bacterium]|nr:peptide deformylase [Eubacteriales bacterium]MDD4389340.1 peptide deformylase [Eubacteriales bacterium]